MDIKREFKVVLTLVVCFIVGFSGKTYSQTIDNLITEAYRVNEFPQTSPEYTYLSAPVDLNINNATLETILKELEEQTYVYFSYLEYVLDYNKEYSLHLKDTPLKEVLQQIFKDSNIQYVALNGGYLVLLRNGDKYKILPKQEVISGTVTDAKTGLTMPGVNIILKGTSTGTATDNEGHFELSVPSLNDTLIVSFIGYRTQEVPINGRTTVNIALQPQILAGEELVVTALGLEQEKRSLSYSTESVDAAQLAKARELNVINSLAGQIAGLSISQTGSGVGSSSRVLLRGNRSISGSSQPLYVVDGVPIRGDISNMSPDIIAEISVLKGPNAAALYGSDAQNGAIIVTTKKGREGEVNVSLSSTFQFRNPIVLTQYQNKYGQGTGGVYSPTSEYNWGPPMDGREVAHWSPDPTLAEKTYSFLPQPNNVKDAFQRGYNSATNLTASVGGENTQTLFSYTFTKATGIVPGNEMDRHNLNLRITSQLTDKLTLDSRLAYIRETIDNQLATGENFSNPVRHIYRMPRNIRTADAENFEYFTSDDRRRQHFWNPGSNGGANPYWTMNRNLSIDKTERVFGLISMTYDFTDYLSLMLRASFDGASGSGEYKWYNDTYIIAQDGEYGLYKNNTVAWNGDFLLSYKEDVSEDWHINANVGGNIMQERNSSLSSNTGASLTVPNFFTISNTQNVITGQSIGSPMDVYSLYGFMQVGWKDAIYLDITGRNDWSSTLPPNSRSYFYPSVGLSAVLSDLIPSFPEFISFAKLRASWARVGSSAPPFSLRRTASLITGGNAGFLKLSTVLPAENLKPEETEAIEVGLNLRFFDNRLGLGFTAYETNTRNQLFQLQVPVGSGVSSVFTNGGNVSNKGIEVLLSATPVQTNNFNWDINMNFSTNQNMVEKISAEQKKLIIAQDYLRKFIIEEDKPFGQVYSRGWVRDDEGNVVVGADGIPIVTNGFSVPVANFTPDWKGGIRSTFSYKNYSLSFLISHRQGGSIVSLTNAILYADGSVKQTLKGREGGLVFGKDIFAGETAVLEDGSPNNITVDPEAFWTSIGGRNAPVGEAFVDDATNTRLRELTISYTLPPSVLAGLPIENLQVSLVGRNLFFIYRASANLDPDLMVGTGAAAAGFESFAPPNTRNYGINIDIDF